MAKGNPAGG